jgi:phosphorylcholine metabolism protein LicD
MRTTVEDIEHPEQHLKKTAEILNKFDIIWYLSFGSALGFYRDSDFIPQDSDIDVSIIVDDKTPINDIIEAFEAEYPMIRRVVESGKQQQTAYKTKDHFIIDLSFYYQERDFYITRHEEGNYVESVEIIGKTKPLKTKYGTYPIPEKIEDYLKIRYDDWQTPKYGATTSSLKQ